MARIDFHPAPGILALQILGAMFVLGFFVFYFRFRRAERLARAGDAERILRYNRMLRGFPNGFYAKMLGKRPLDKTTR